MGAINLSKQTVNLSKHDKINLTKASEGLSKIRIGLGWSPARRKGLIGLLSRLVETIDCDAWVMLLNDKKEIINNSIIYYGNLRLGDVIVHHGDNLIGGGNGDDEQITIDLSRLDNMYTTIVIGVTIYRGYEKNQSFGSIRNTFVRVVDERDNFEICRFNQEEMAEDKDAITFIAGELYKEHGEWYFKAIGKGTRDRSIGAAASNYVKEH